MKGRLSSIFSDFSLGFWISSVLILLFSLALGYGLVSQRIFSDYPGHLGIHRLYLDLGKFPFPPGFFIAYSFFAILLPFSQSVKLGMVAVTVLSIYWRFYLSYSFLRKSRSDNSVAYFALGLMLFAPAYLFWPEGSNFLLGKYSTAYWHSATLTMVWPFSLLLFFKALNYTNESKRRDLFVMYLISVFILLIKPSFLFCVIPVFPLFVWIEKGRGNVFYQAVIYALVMLGLILIEKWWIYEVNSIDPYLYEGGNKNVVKILPLAVWKYFSKSPVIDFFSSFLFLILSLVLFGKKLFSQPDFKLAFALSMVGLVIYLLLAEEGPRFIDGNFSWQIPICLFLLYLSILNFFLKNYSLFKKEKSSRFRVGILLLVFIFHSLSGIHYILHYFQTGYYF